jgi:CheY-like chemotaxis protein
MRLNRILCVDDDPDILSILDFSLTRIGSYTVLACSNGLSAVSEVTRFEPDLILLDVMMPGLSGPQTLAALRGPPHAVSTPVVFMTARSLVHELEALLALGATGLIVKPFNPLTLAQDILPYWEHGRRHRTKSIVH